MNRFVTKRINLPSAFLLLAVTGLITGCNYRSPDAKPQNLPGLTTALPQNGGAENAMLLPGGDYSLVTIRQRPPVGNQDNARILCSAPSPDWASAITTAQSLQGTVSTADKTSVSAQGSNSLAETITAMVGRTAGVVALRDGLYSACQAYANGAIGKDAYALILSQYGNLLVSLAGGTSSNSSTATPTLTTPSGVAVAVSTGTTTTIPSGAQQVVNTSNNAAQGGSTQVQQMQLQLVQAMLVACISNNDRTTRSPTDMNTLLGNGKYCSTLISNIVAKVPTLLGSLTSGNTTNSPSGEKPLSDKLITELQTFLKAQDCEGCRTLEVDGLDGPKTQAALTSYRQKH